MFKKYINNIFTQYSIKYKCKLDLSIYEELLNNYINKKDIYFPLVVYKIYNEDVSIIEKTIEKTIKRNNKVDERIFHNLNLIKNTLKWCKKNNKKIPNTLIHIWISDRFPWEIEKSLNKIPIYVYATPIDIKLPLFPDNTFYCLTIYKKYKGECYDWDAIKKLFKKTNKMYLEKIKVAYFKGTPTTKNRYRIREQLEEYSKNKKNMIIKLDGWVNYKPITNVSKYQFLLNLPGHYPWSNRFKYLFLTNSIIININVKTKSYEHTSYNDDLYISFIDLIMKPNIDYIDIIYNYTSYRGYDINIINKVNKINNDEILKIGNKIENIVDTYSSNTNKYDKMIKSYQNKIEKLSNDKIYEYIYELILENSKVITYDII
jgi:hypothetical protein